MRKCRERWTWGSGHRSVRLQGEPTQDGGVLGVLLGHRYTHGTLSALADQILEALAFVYLDWFFLKVYREGLGVQKKAICMALGGGTPKREGQILGFWLLPTESASAWEEALEELWSRGLRGVLLFITEGLGGIEEAVRRVYPMA